MSKFHFLFVSVSIQIKLNRSTAREETRITTAKPRKDSPTTRSRVRTYARMSINGISNIRLRVPVFSVLFCTRMWNVECSGGRTRNLLRWMDGDRWRETLRVETDTTNSCEVRRIRGVHNNMIRRKVVLGSRRRTYEYADCTFILVWGKRFVSQLFSS